MRQNKIMRSNREAIEQKKFALRTVIKNTLSEIQIQEDSAKEEFNEWKKEVILEKSIYYKARERGKLQKNQIEEKKEYEDDYLNPIISKLMLNKDFMNYKKGIPFTLEQANKVQNGLYQMHKDRIKMRAKIIQDRIDLETRKLKEEFNTTTNTDMMTSDEKEKYKTKYAEITRNISILTERAYQQYQYALEKFKEIEEKIKDDPRFEILRNK